MKKEKKQELRAFIRSFFITAVLLGCLFGGIYSAAKAYENTLSAGFGREEKAFSLTEDGIRIFDFML